jgi:hypothetical protein
MPFKKTVRVAFKKTFKKAVQVNDTNDRLLWAVARPVSAVFAGQPIDWKDVPGHQVPYLGFDVAPRHHLWFVDDCPRSHLPPEGRPPREIAKAVGDGAGCFSRAAGPSLCVNLRNISARQSRIICSGKTSAAGR